VSVTYWSVINEGDVVDPSNLLRALEETQPAVIFHLAAQTLVRQSHREPRRTFEVNAIGTLNLLEAVRQLKLRCAVIVVTSDKCYENRGRQKPLCESDPLGGGDPYSASKAAAEIITAAYRKSFSPPLKSGAMGFRLQRCERVMRLEAVIGRQIASFLTRLEP
jgi:CDP-glucose 4,6-dehydratase